MQHGRSLPYLVDLADPEDLLSGVDWDDEDDEDNDDESDILV